MSESPNKIFMHVSPSSLSDMDCDRRFGWRNYILPYENIRRDEGSVTHLFLKHFYRGIIQRDQWEDTVERIDDAREHSLITTKAELIDSDYSADLIEHCAEIFTRYTFESPARLWIPISAEEPTSRILFENDKIQILFELITDLVIQEGESEVPVDHKTKSAFESRVTARTHQYLGTCWALESGKIYENRIGFQKNDPPGGRFQPKPILLSPSVIEEWRRNTIALVLQYLGRANEGIEITNDSSCWNCRFHDLCLMPSESREILLETDFVKKESKSIYERAK